MFNNLLVLGLVPGTNLMITFNELVALLDAALVLYLLRKRMHLRLPDIRYYWLYARLYIEFRKGQQLSLPL
ncbi:MAG TPA: hypothetical protein VHD84_00690 [Candidatus Saccharimonadales bacterium]|nr:hypothetical protein [Candidatus Saccharimonadales bacterium]